MKKPRFVLLIALMIALFGAGCGSIDVSPGTDPNRVLTGMIVTDATLPAGAEVTVRLLALPGAAEPARAGTNELTAAPQPSLPATERVLGEFTQKLTAVAAAPVPFRIEYYADDATLRRGLNIDARVSFGGKLRYRTINAHVITLSNARFPQDVTLQPIER